VRRRPAGEIVSRTFRESANGDDIRPRLSSLVGDRRATIFARIIGSVLGVRVPVLLRACVRARARVCVCVCVCVCMRACVLRARVAASPPPAIVTATGCYDVALSRLRFVIKILPLSVGATT